MHIHIYSKHKTKKKTKRDFVHEHSEAHSWTNLYLRLRTFIKAKPLNGDWPSRSRGGLSRKGLFQDSEQWTPIQHNHKFHPFQKAELKETNTCTELPPLCGSNGNFMHSPQGRRIQRHLLKPDDMRQYYGCITPSSHPKRHTQSFTVPKHIQHSTGMGFGPWKLNVKLKIFPKQI